jgi:Bacterial Ig domain
MNKKRLALIIAVVVAAVVIAVALDTLLANHRPAIANLEAEPERVAPSGTCQIVCNATDADGDQLSYGWSADGGAISGEGARVTWTAPGAVGSYNITVIVSDSRGGAVTDLLTVTVRRNNSPTINNLTASAVWTLPSGSLNVTCDASDSDGDELSYEWTITGGIITGTGTVVAWTAPQEIGIYYVTVVVRDGHGSSSSRTLPISVVTGQPPIIENLLVTAEHCYLRSYAWGYKVGKEHTYDIECIVTDGGSGLFYEWSWPGGNISGQDSSISWAAPDTAGQLTVTVIVSDIAGNKGVKDLLLEVASCSTCSFPGCSG